MNPLPYITPIPFRDPLAAFVPFAGDPMAALLDSALPGAQGRFSYIAVDPFRIVRSTPRPWSVTVDGQMADGDPFTVLARELARFPVSPIDAPVPFAGGAIGFFGYELGGVLERLPTARTQPFPYDMAVGLYDVVAAFDVLKQEAWVIASGLPEMEEAARCSRAQERGKALAAALGTGDLGPLPPPPQSRWYAEQTRTEYEAQVVKVIEAIHAGDIYQANYTQRFAAELPEGTAPYDLYRRLRTLAPAPFAAFINAGEGMHIMSASPERFLSVDVTGSVETRPIKGTRPRGNTPDEDRVLAEQLKASAKDRAENLMIVDLLRNDLARVCVPGSVTVPTLCQHESFPAVHHLVSVVTGQLRPGAGALDLLQAAFPGGSVTGAPKIRAMETIHAHEPTARGPYCGTIAWLGFDGAMDSSIVIRTLVQSGHTLAAQAGGGIVAESDPATEYEESLTKVRALLAVVNDEPSA